ncbi:unnamed protein product, partial [Cyprideis torosa]
AKSDDQLESDQALLNDGSVWIVHKKGFSRGEVLSKEPDPAAEESDAAGGGASRVKVRIEANGDELTVDEEDVEKANPTSLDFVEDLTHLRHVNESSCLNVLRHRYSENLIHTNAGPPITLILNPTSPLAVYSEKVAIAAHSAYRAIAEPPVVAHLFAGCRSDDMPPHIYSVAQRAHSALLSSRRDQSIVLLGRSGAGKTCNFQHVLNYLVQVGTGAGTGACPLTPVKLAAIFTLLESFGSCRTLLNTSASRFTKLFALDFDPNGTIVSASLQCLMLEKSRVSCRPEGQPSFHVFYQFLAGLDPGSRSELGLDGKLSETNLLDDRQTASMAWARVTSAMHALEFPADPVRAIYAVLAAIYHLGAAGLERSVHGRFQFVRPNSANLAASLLGVSPEELLRMLSTEGGDDPLGGLAAGLYGEVVAGVVALINRAISTPTATSSSLHSILVVDTPGFQNPASLPPSRASPSASPTLPKASFADLCHNYVQERLQLLFHATTFESARDRYAQEHIDFDISSLLESSALSTPAPMVNFLDRHTESSAGRQTFGAATDGSKGLLWLLDDEALVPGGSDSSFVDKLQASHSSRGKRHSSVARTVI